MVREKIISAIDVHAHYYPAKYVAVVADLATHESSAGATARRFLNSAIISGDEHFTGAIARRVAMMDAADVEIQVLSMASMNIWHPDPDTRVSLTQAYNDGLAELCEAHPRRFRFVASLPFPHVDEAVAEARRVRGLPGWVGYCIPTTIAGQPINAPQWTAVYAEMNSQPALATVHPDGFAAPGVLDDFSMEWAIGAVFEDTIATIRLLCSGLVRDHANLHWLVPHLGGTLPFVLHRLLWRWRFEAEYLGTPGYDAADLHRVLFDTANSTAETLRFAASVLPRETLAYGTDFPFLDKAGFTESWQMAQEFVSDAGRGAPLSVLGLIHGNDSTAVTTR